MGQIAMKAARGKQYRIIVADREGNTGYKDIDRRAEERGVAGRLIDLIETDKTKAIKKKKKEEKEEDDFNSGKSIS
ncbi:hypothetical protein ES705_43579 [subsurface metagenome]